MSKNKARNARQKNETKNARLKQKKRSRNAVIIVSCGLIFLFALLLVFPNIRSEVKFVKDSGGFTDPRNGKEYYPADISAYEIRTEFYPENFYGRMDGDKVYTIPGVKGNKWLVRQLGDSLFELYYEKNVTLPEIDEFEASGLYLFVDSTIILSREEITDKAELENIVSVIAEGERADRPFEINETYSLRFISEKYGHIYFCFEYLLTDEGSYFFDHVSSSYIKANGVLDKYVESLKEKSGE